MIVTDDKTLSTISEYQIGNSLTSASFQGYGYRAREMGRQGIQRVDSC